MPATLMGLYEECSARREMYWFGPNEGAYEPHCNPSSPTMPHMPHTTHDPHKNPQFHSPIDTGCPPHHDSAPLTPSSSTSSLSSSSVASHAPSFVSPVSDRSHYSIAHEGESPILSMHEKIISIQGMRSPCPPSTPHGPQDLSSSAVSSVSSVEHSTPSSSSNTVEVFCAGCLGRINDRFYLLVVERHWHAACLRCSACHRPLDTAGKCFAKDGNIFCKEDYQRLFSHRRCARCGLEISSRDLVMCAREFFFHVQCFTCTQCHTQLTKGDHFRMNGPHIYCRDHYQISSPMDGGSISPLTIPPGVPFQGPAIPSGPLPPHPHPHHGHPHLSHDGMPPFHPPEQMGKIQFFNGVGAPHKGRPRKRKPKDEPMDTNMNIPGGYDLEGPYGSHGNSCQQIRAKRIRTSFQHHQLRTMKHYFTINHNPDAKDLKNLAMKTKLSKRVLQVWFQNARAKWRRQIMTSSKDPKTEGASSGCQDGSGAEGSGTEYAASSPPAAVSPLSPDASSESSTTTQLPYQQMF